jgi:hypothetical protein
VFILIQGLMMQRFRDDVRLHKKQLWSFNHVVMSTIRFMIKSVLTLLKGTVSRDFRPSVFKIKQPPPPLAHDSCSKIFSNFVLNSQRYSIIKFDYARCTHDQHTFATISANSKRNSKIFQVANQGPRES